MKIKNKPLKRIRTRNHLDYVSNKGMRKSRRSCRLWTFSHSFKTTVEMPGKKRVSRILRGSSIFVRFSNQNRFVSSTKNPRYLFSPWNSIYELPLFRTSQLMPVCGLKTILWHLDLSSDGGALLNQWICWAWSRQGLQTRKLCDQRAVFIYQRLQARSQISNRVLQLFDMWEERFHVKLVREENLLLRIQMTLTKIHKQEILKLIVFNQKVNSLCYLSFFLLFVIVGSQFGQIK